MEKSVWRFLEPLLEPTPYEIYDVEYKKEGSEWFLRVYIDKDGVIDLDDCEAVTNLINEPLDELDPIRDPYFLEVSSPGVERHLGSVRHFRAVIGEKIRVKTYTKIENSKEWVGTLTEVSEEEITIDVQGKPMVFPYDKIAKANLSVF
ncbi:MAG: ribosome maturation factor RimP [Bacillota bacterium]